MDIRFVDGDVLWENGDMRIIPDSVVQELTFRLDTYKGEHWFYPNYGVRLLDALGEQNSPDIYYFLINEIEDALGQDDRIPPNSSHLKLTQELDSITMILDVAGRSVEKVVKIT